MKDIGITIAICTLNGGPRIERVLDGILQSDSNKLNNLEILLIDNNSNDNVVHLFENKLRNTEIKHRSITEKKQGLSYARLRAFNEANYNLITFIDDDNYILGNWFELIYQTFSSDPTIGALGALGITHGKYQNEDWFKKTEKAYALGTQSKRNIFGTNSTEQKYLYGAGITLRCDIIKKAFANGYCSILTGRSGTLLLSGEDSELCEIIKLSGLKCQFNKNLVFFHDIPKNRVTLNYASSLYTSFGIAFVYLLPLRRLTDYKYVPSFILSTPRVVRGLLQIYLNYITLINFFKMERAPDFQMTMTSSAIAEIDRLGDQYNFIFVRNSINANLIKTRN